jgi:hypothetical protein
MVDSELAGDCWPGPLDPCPKLGGPSIAAPVWVRAPSYEQKVEEPGDSEDVPTRFP